MSNLKDWLKEATKDVNHQETTTGGGFDYEPPAAGVTVGRFIEYVELGKQKQPDYKGKAKPDAEEARITFALTSPKNTKTVDTDDGEKTFQEKISFIVPIKLNEKSKFKKVFEKMRRGREDITHMAMMLGEPFRLEVFHTVSETTKRTYANLWSDTGEIGIHSPRYEDPMTGEVTDLSSRIPEAIDPERVFLFDHPMKEHWDSLFIDGTRTVKDDKGKETEVSKNWLQAKIMEATNFSGSAVEQMLTGLVDLPDGKETKTETKKDENVQIGEEEVLGKEEPKEEQKPDSSADDALAALGLT